MISLNVMPMCALMQPALAYFIKFMSLRMCELQQFAGECWSKLDDNDASYLLALVVQEGEQDNIVRIRVLVVVLPKSRPDCKEAEEAKDEDCDGNEQSSQERADNKGAVAGAGPAPLP